MSGRDPSHGAAMTFEQQVFDALAQVLDEAPSEAGEVMVLAPRVAAAIEKTIMAERQACGRDGWHPSTVAWHKTALAALRGDA